MSSATSSRRLELSPAGDFVKPHRTTSELYLRAKKAGVFILQLPSSLGGCFSPIVWPVVESRQHVGLSSFCCQVFPIPGSMSLRCGRYSSFSQNGGGGCTLVFVVSLVS